MKKIYKIISMLLGGCILLSGCGGESSKYGEYVEEKTRLYEPIVTEKTFSKIVLEDKILGSIVGHSIGLGSGFEFVTDNGKPVISMDEKYFEANGEIATGTLGNNIFQYGPYAEAYRRVFPGMVKSDDDNTVNFLNLHILEECGVDVSYEDISNAWVKYNLNDDAAGKNALKLIQENSYLAPFTGANVYGNYYYGCTEPWIHNQMLGLMFPGMPVTASRYLDMFGSISGDFYVLDVLQIFGLAYCYALEDSSAKSCLERAMAHIGTSNALYEIYEYVSDCYQQDPTDWRTCVKGVYERRMTLENLYGGEHNHMAMNVNAGFMMVGIIFGENDFEKSIKITSLAGFDGDCTTATVGGLVATCIGYENLPQKYKDFLNKDSIYVNDKAWLSIQANYPDRQTFETLVNRFIKNTEAFIEAQGGAVNGDNYTVMAQEYVKIPHPTVVNYGFENGTDGWSVEGKVDFSSTGVCAHSGKKAGTLFVGDSDAAVYQKVSLVTGNVYELNVFLYSSDYCEIELFAKDDNGSITKSVVNPLAGAKLHMKGVLQFVATSDSMDIGIHVFKKDKNKIITLDDVIIKNVSDKVNGGYYLFDAEQCAVSENAKIIKANTATKKAVSLAVGDGLQFSFVNENEYYNLYRIYYHYEGTLIGKVEVFVDGEKICNLPLIPQGEQAFLKGDFVDLPLHVEKGEHTIRIKALDQKVEIDKIEVRRGAIL